MKKDMIRDYAVSAFRTYSAVGRPGGAKFEAVLRTCLEQLPGQICRPDDMHEVRRRENMAYRVALLFDMVAVGRTVETLGCMKNGELCLHALDMVYFYRPDLPLARGDIEARVVRASMHLYASQASVWRALARSRHIFAVQRGLRDDNGKIDSRAQKLCDMIISG